MHENVRLAVQARESGPQGRGGLDLFSVWSDHQGLDRRSRRDPANQVRLDDKARRHAASLPHGDQRKLEVAMLMALDPKVFMFDEPTAGMSVDEVPVILDLIRQLKKTNRKDRLILLVEHKMDVVRELADRIIVLHNGTLVADGEPGGGDCVAGGAASLSGHGAGGAGMSDVLPNPLLELKGVHTHIGAYHILHGVDFAVPAPAR